MAVLPATRFACQFAARIARQAPPPTRTRHSMSVDNATVRRIAKLARIALPEERVEPMMAELNGILGWIEQLQEVDVEGIEPMTSVVAQKMRMRDDVVTAGGDAAAIVANAPLTEDNFFVVPKVVE